MTTPQSPSSEPTAEKASIPSATLPSILDLSRDRLTSTLIEMGEKKFRAYQVWRSIYHETVGSFDEMSTLSKPFREKLKESYTFSALEQAMFLTSADKTTSKALYKLHDG